MITHLLPLDASRQSECGVFVTGDSTTSEIGAVDCETCLRRHEAIVAGDDPDLPPTIGEILVSKVCRPLGMAQDELARHLGVSDRTFGDLVSGELRLTIPIALRLEAATGVPAERWLAAQVAREVYQLRNHDGALYREVERLPNTGLDLDAQVELPYVI